MRDGAYSGRRWPKSGHGGGAARERERDGG